MHNLLLHYGYAFLILGLIIEGDATLVAAAILAGQQYFDLRWVVGLAMGVTIAGNELLFEIGKMGLLRRLLGPNDRRRVSRWLHSSRSGFLTLLFSRFMWGFRLVIPMAAGWLQIRRRRFILANVLGGVIWVTVLAYFGVALQQVFISLHNSFRPYQSDVAVGVFLLGIALGIGSIPWRQARRQANRHEPLLALARKASEAPPAPSSAAPGSPGGRRRPRLAGATGAGGRSRSKHAARKPGEPREGSGGNEANPPRKAPGWLAPRPRSAAAGRPPRD